MICYHKLLWPHLLYNLSPHLIKQRHVQDFYFLQQFHRIVEFDEINNWEGSSVSQVCFAEGTPVFVKLAEIAKLEDETDMFLSDYELEIQMLVDS